MTDLLTLLYLPISGVLTCAILPYSIKIGQRAIKVNHIAIATFFSLLTLAISINILTSFSSSGAAGITRNILSPSLGYRLYADGISILLTLLTTFITPIALTFSSGMLQNPKQNQTKMYSILFLALEFCAIGTFLVDHILLFYIFFESTLVPMLLIIGMWGGKKKIYSMYKLFLYTFIGSIPFLLSILYISHVKASSIPTLQISQIFKHTHSLPERAKILIWASMMLSFAIKLPMIPVHTWLPSAHVNAPTSGSMMLAGVLIKIGGYGMIKMPILMFPGISLFMSPFVTYLSIIAILYTALVALSQNDIKKMIAYSSISHMGFVTAGIFSLNKLGIQAGVFQMISHGLISSGLFLSIGIIYMRVKTRNIHNLGGLARRMPIFAIHLMILVMASAGLPGTSGFVGEISSIIACYKAHGGIAFFAAIGMIVGAAYILLMYRKTMLGKTSNTQLQNTKDLTILEKISTSLLTLPIVLTGIHPSPILNTISKSYIFAHFG